MRKDFTIKYLRVGSRLVNKHSGKICVIIGKSDMGYRILEEGSTLPTTELKTDMGRYFRRSK